jgi:hypothetical protein
MSSQFSIVLHAIGDTGVLGRVPDSRATDVIRVGPSVLVDTIFILVLRAARAATGHSRPTAGRLTIHCHGISQPPHFGLALGREGLWLHNVDCVSHLRRAGFAKIKMKVCGPIPPQWGWSQPRRIGAPPSLGPVLQSMEKLYQEIARRTGARVFAPDEVQGYRTSPQNEIISGAWEGTLFEYFPDGRPKIGHIREPQ